MSSIAGEASLLVAAFQLLAVRAVTDAERAADIESGDVVTPSGIIEKPEPAPTPDPETYQSDRQVHAQSALVREPAYRPNPPLHYSARPIVQRVVVMPDCDVACQPSSVTTSPIEPPWKILPWMDRAPHRTVLVREIKLVATGSDISFRGQMLDIVV